ncbi:MAG: dihydroorotate dehydrogenase [Candidatus Omnitrophica bacterium]|jgi:dihydroorotate dehydrogenase (NAD+) catalytic subunit|nr:dihydroorotate dehydrogenase [Candidatus Omnitrophota bacterium]MDD5660937.1 dihydroorotate dehydrogenase [Candidatus Omnitrophota bacterium]
MVKKMKPDLSVRIGKLVFKNPVMVASGTFGYAEEFKDFIDLKKLGAIVTKTITLKPRPGNVPPRTCETPSGMLNSIGLENPGIDKFIKEKLLPLGKLHVPIIVSIAAEDSPQEFDILVTKLDKADAVYAIELNISCPNLLKDKLISQDAQDTFALVSRVRKLTQKCLITKLSPNVTSISDIALAAQNAGSDAVALINTLGGMCIDVNKRTPKLGPWAGGLSGPAIRPVAIKMVWETYRKIRIPIIGMGGIIDTESALEFFLAGSRLISVGTANFINPQASVEILAGLMQYMIDNKISSLSGITGRLKTCKD